MGLPVVWKKYGSYHWFSLALIASFPLLVPFGRLSEIPIILMAIGGVFLLINERKKLFLNREIILFTFVFSAIWIPVWISLIGAVYPPKTLSVGLTFVRMFLAGVFIVSTMAGSPGVSGKVLKTLALLLCVWVADALLQAAVGYNLIAYPDVGGRVNSFFGESLNFGPYMATFSPLLFVYALLNWRWQGQSFAFLGVVVVVFMAGSRSGWVVLAFVIAGIAVWIVRREGWKILSRFAIMALVLMGVAGGILQFSQPFSDRLRQSMLVFSKDSESVNHALSNRLPIWETTFEVIRANPINGVGARGLRYAYEDFASPDDYFVQKDYTVHHAHNLVLDIGSETGLIGLTGLVLAMGILLCAWRAAGPEERLRAFPYALVLFVIFLPINSHFAMYSSAWSTTYFWAMSLFFGALAKQEGFKKAA
ncbi:O-antigen ligase family protein [Desulfobotulus sp. H1]|uniref:O-antigen ligase family protein n=1 Tax=Desulfobotulus pelophilus TaxID=2823377 RepID=A0ABT3NCP0_9BACT|nr:O-antigen ligase family protein [Desulfobotulus pelophilus]MCW7755208.1 O-antigen ligase family protein [Desulfobotulus pelophilus]